ncbi:YveK family protein [Ornithinibacillus scapharcae]|uniref:YveK family protein n=1 Tax=Ornithinibacillus scapharcae TaxID=1147159 RepID=UPI000225B2D3|nr:Wzz/FepE/Etk N-terminal domain-containing protein [Ornithinibacillus scapharcae]
MKETLSIQEILSVLRKRMVFIVLLTVGLVGVAAALSYFVMTPTYQSSSQFIVIQQPNENVAINMSEIESNLELMNTYKEIVSSPSVLEKVMNELGLTETPEEIRKRISVESGENSQVITVSAIGSSPETAAELANLVVEQFRETIISIMRVENVFVLSQANPVLSEEPIQPRPIINMIIAGVIGLATGIGLALLLEFFNTKVKLESDFEELGITLLGTISIFEKRYVRNRRRKNVHVQGKEVEKVETTKKKLKTS